jgi:hypothetical protein
MNSLVRGASLLVFATLFSAALPADEKKPDTPDKTIDKTEKASDNTDKKPATKAKKEKKEKFEYSTKFDAKLTKLEGSTKNFSVQVTDAWTNPQRAAENQVHYARRIGEIGREKNPQSRQLQLVELQLDMQRRATNAIEKKTRDVDLTADEKMKVRMFQPPLDYDDKGNPKKYTKAELKKLKGPDTSLPGYMADYEQLKAGQLVTVYLAKLKQDKSKTAKKNADDADLDLMRPKAILVLIVADPPAQ